MKNVKDHRAGQQEWNNPSEMGHFWNVVDCCVKKALTDCAVGIIADSKYAHVCFN